jgi:voltage-gated potassium channel
MAPDHGFSEMQRRLLRFVLVLLVITTLGTLGYVVIEGWPAFDALYMTVITLATIGFEEVHPLSTAGRAFTIALIVAGVSAVGYFVNAVAQLALSGELAARLRRRRMVERLEALSGHYVVCGYGRVGQEVVEDLHRRGRRCVVVDSARPSSPTVPDVPFVVGDAANDDILRQAGIDRARGLVAVTGDDPTNLFVTLSAHALNPKLVIVARANDNATEPKLLRAGASHVISPNIISGRRIAAQLLNPAVADFLDVVMHSGQLEMWMEEFQVAPGSELHGRTVAAADVRRRTGANVLAVRRHDQGAILTNPPADLTFAPGDILIALGTGEQLAALSRAAGQAG